MQKVVGGGIKCFHFYFLISFLVLKLFKKQSILCSINQVQRIFLANKMSKEKSIPPCKSNKNIIIRRVENIVQYAYDNEVPKKTEKLLSIIKLAHSLDKIIDLILSRMKKKYIIELSKEEMKQYFENNIDLYIDFVIQFDLNGIIDRVVKDFKIIDKINQEQKDSFDKFKDDLLPKIIEKKEDIHHPIIEIIFYAYIFYCFGDEHVEYSNNCYQIIFQYLRLLEPTNPHHINILKLSNMLIDHMIHKDQKCIRVNEKIRQKINQLINQES